MADDVTWNDEEFFVAYQSLKAELKVGRCPLQCLYTRACSALLFRHALKMLYFTGIT